MRCSDKRAGISERVPVSVLDRDPESTPVTPSLARDLDPSRHLIDLAGRGRDPSPHLAICQPRRPFTFVGLSLRYGNARCLPTTQIAVLESAIRKQVC